MKTDPTKFTLLFLCLGLILSSGCTTIKPLSIEVLIPPDTLIYPGLKSATIVCQNRLIGISDSLFSEEPDSLVIDSIFRKKLLEECTLGLQELLETSPGIENVKRDSVALEILKPLSTSDHDTLDNAMISEICLLSNTDIVVILEGINAWDTLFYSWVFHRYDEDGTGESVKYQNLALVFAARWSIFDAISCQLLDRYLYIDTVIWSSEVYQIPGKEVGFPEPENAYQEALYWAGNGFGRRIVSIWEETDRFYYCTNHQLMKQACQEASNNDWREAAIIWKELAEHKNKSLAAKAAHNMALVCEMEDKLELAQSWAIKSFLIYRTRAVEDYLDILNSRLFIKKKFDF